MPFDNFSNDPDQDFFADGITEDIITELSMFRWLFVIARNSSFSFKGRSLDVRQIAQSLDVRYLLEGSVRRAGNRVRITSQLIDATDGKHLWADKFDGNLDDIFELQDQVTLDVVGAIEPSLRQAEINRLRAKPTEDLQAYELYLRALAHFHLVTDEDNQETIRLLAAAIELDPGYSTASGLLAWCYVQRRVQRWNLDAGDVTYAAELARRVIESDRADAMALAYAAHTVMIFTGDMVTANATFERSMDHNPNSAIANMLFAANLSIMDEPERALEHADRALRLSPRDTFRYAFNLARSLALFFMQRYAESADAARAGLADRRNFLLLRYALIGALVQSGDTAAAKVEADELIRLSPNVTIENIRKSAPFIKPREEQYVHAWREAGIREK